MPNTTMGFFFSRSAAALLLGVLVGCGGGGGGSVEVGVGVDVVDPGPEVAPLAMALTRVGPQAIAIDWSDDPFVASFLVVRDGHVLAEVRTTTSLVDASVFVDETYCYEVEGYDAALRLVALSSVGCITVFP